MSETSEDEQALSQTSEEELSGEEEQDNTDAEEEDDIENAEEQEEESDSDADAEDGKETNAEKELTWKDLVNCSTNIVICTHFIIMCTCRVWTKRCARRAMNWSGRHPRRSKKRLYLLHCKVKMSSVWPKLVLARQAPLHCPYCTPCSRIPRDISLSFWRQHENWLSKSANNLRHWVSLKIYRYKMKMIAMMLNPFWFYVLKRKCEIIISLFVTTSELNRFPHINYTYS